MQEIKYDPILPLPFRPLLRDKGANGTHRFVVRGGRFSGKTTTVFEDALDGFMTIPGANIVVARADDCDFYKTSFTTMKKSLQKFGIDKYCKIPKRTGDIVFRPNGNIIRFVATGGDEHRTKGLDFDRGYVHRFIHDEAQDLNEEYEVKGAEKTLLRFMGDTTKWIYIYNPPPLRNEFANVYFPRQVQDGRALEIYSSWQDISKLLTQEQKDEILRDKNSDYNYYRYEYLGELVLTNGLVYPQLKREKHIVDIFSLLAQGDRISELILGLDEGTAYDSTCVTPIAVMQSGRAVVLDCYENDPVKAGQQSPSEQSRALRDFLVTLLNRCPYLMSIPRRWIFESAEGGQMLKLQFENDYGEECCLVKNKNIMGDIKRVRSMLSEGILLFDCSAGSNTMQLIKDIENYIFDDKTGKPKKGQRDDTIDSLEYATKLYYDSPLQTY